MCNIYYILNKKLSISELRYADEKIIDDLTKIQNPKRYRERLGCYYLLERALEEKNIDPRNINRIGRSKNNKPYFFDNSLRFSFSHSKGLIVLAMSYDNLAIDVELIRNIEYSIFRDIIKVNNRRDFFRLWCAREALVKYLDEDFSFFRKLSLELKNDKLCYIKDESIYLSEFMIGNYQACLASRIKPNYIITCLD